MVGSPCSPKDSQESSPTPQFKSINSSVLSFLYSPTLTSMHDYWKTITLTRQTFVRKVMSLLFNVLSGLVIAFLPRSKCLLISWLQSPSAVILEPKIKSVTVKVCPSICHEVMEHDAMIFVFLICWILSQLFHSPLPPLSRGSFIPLHFLPLGWYLLHIWGYWYYSGQSWFQLVLHPAWHFTWWTLHISSNSNESEGNSTEDLLGRSKRGLYHTLYRKVDQKFSFENSLSLPKPSTRILIVWPPLFPTDPSLFVFPVMRI